jgi:hypothetical protein
MGVEARCAEARYGEAWFGEVGKVLAVVDMTDQHRLRYVIACRVTN